MMRFFRLDTEQLTAEDEEAVQTRLPGRYERAMRYQREEAKKQCIGAGALLLRAFGRDEKAFGVTPEGKPFLKKGPAFSISHSGSQVILAVSGEKGREIGADVERVRPFNEAAAKRVLTEEEYAFVRALPGEEDGRFIQLWTVKESVLKCRGEGFTVPANEVNALPALSGDPAEAFGKRYRVSVEKRGDYCYAVAEEVLPERKTHPVLFSLVQWTYGLPQNLIGAVLMLALKVRHPGRASGRYRECRTFSWDRSGSMSLGMFLFLGNAGKRLPFVRAHEYGHSIQSLILGPLYLPVIGIPSFLRANVPFLAKNWKSGKASYYDFYPERWANRAGRAEETGRILL